MPKNNHLHSRLAKLCQGIRESEITLSPHEPSKESCEIKHFFLHL